MTTNEAYEARVTELEAEGLTRSDAQAVVEAEDMMAGQSGTFIERACSIMNLAWQIHEHGGEEITVRLNPHSAVLGVYESATRRNWNIYGDGLASIGDSIRDCEAHLNAILGNLQ